MINIDRRGIDFVICNIANESEIHYISRKCPGIVSCIVQHSSVAVYSMEGKGNLSFRIWAAPVLDWDCFD